MKTILNWGINILAIILFFISCFVCIIMMNVCLALFPTFAILNASWIPTLGMIGFAGSFSSNVLVICAIMKERFKDEDKK